MEHEAVIAFKRLEDKIDDIGLMVAELVIQKRNNTTKTEEKTNKKIKTTNKQKTIPTEKTTVENEPEPNY